MRTGPSPSGAAEAIEITAARFPDRSENRPSLPSNPFRRNPAFCRAASICGPNSSSFAFLMLQAAAQRRSARLSLFAGSPELRNLFRKLSPRSSRLRKRSRCSSRFAISFAHRLRLIEQSLVCLAAPRQKPDPASIANPALLQEILEQCVHRLEAIGVARIIAEQYVVLQEIRHRLCRRPETPACSSADHTAAQSHRQTARGAPCRSRSLQRPRSSAQSAAPPREARCAAPTAAPTSCALITCACWLRSKCSPRWRIHSLPSRIKLANWLPISSVKNFSSASRNRKSISIFF